MNECWQYRYTIGHISVGCAPSRLNTSCNWVQNGVKPVLYPHLQEVDTQLLELALYIQSFGTLVIDRLGQRLCQGIISGEVGHMYARCI